MCFHKTCILWGQMTTCTILEFKTLGRPRLDHICDLALCSAAVQTAEHLGAKLLAKRFQRDVHAVYRRMPLVKQVKDRVLHHHRRKGDLLTRLAETP